MATRQWRCSLDTMDSKKSPSISDRKRERLEMGGEYTYEDPSLVDAQLNFLPQMVQLLEAMRERDERGKTIGNRKQEIYKAMTQVEDIHPMKRSLDEYSNSVYKQLLEKQQARIRGLFDSTSPLLSLNKPILRHLIGYLDEEALLSLEEASTTVKLYLMKEAVVELDNRRKEQDASGFSPIPLEQKAKKRDPTPMERAQSYRMAAAFARNMETLASQHYNYDQKAIEKPKPEEETGAGRSFYSSKKSRKKEIVFYEDMEVHCSGCEELSQMSNPTSVMWDYGDGGDSVFVRLSYRTNIGQRSPLIWQGFVQHQKYQCMSDLMTMTLGMERTATNVIIKGLKAQEMEWPEFREYKRMLDAGVNDHEKASHLEHLAANLQVTVALVPTTPGFSREKGQSFLFTPDAPQGKGAYLLVATGGFDRCSGSTVYLKPRNKEPHDKKWNPRNFLETSIGYNERTNELTLSIMDDNPYQHDRYVERSTTG